MKKYVIQHVEYVLYGYTKFVCKICGDEYIDETTYTDMISHQTTNGQCSVCEKFIVEEYVKTVKPVSSSIICKELNCSSATVRNEMVLLEDFGYLEKNHFASGRQPSEEGYKYYVENLMTPKDLKFQVL